MQRKHIIPATVLTCIVFLLTALSRKINILEKIFVSGTCTVKLIMTTHVKNLCTHIYTRVTKNVPLFILCALILLRTDWTGWWRPHQQSQSARNNISAIKMNRGT